MKHKKGYNKWLSKGWTQTCLTLKPIIFNHMSGMPVRFTSFDNSPGLENITGFLGEAWIQWEKQLWSSIDIYVVRDKNW